MTNYRHLELVLERVARELERLTTYSEFHRGVVVERLVIMIEGALHVVWENNDKP